MKTNLKSLATLGMFSAIAMSSAALIGCDETVKKDETVRTNPDGSKVEKSMEVQKEDDGTMTKTTETTMTPASQVNH